MPVAPEDRRSDPPVRPDALPARDGVVFNVMRFAVHDGPGIRTTVFMKGCPLDCWWCHNPEGRRPEPEIVFWASRCIGCGRCVEVCPTGAAGRARPGAGLTGLSDRDPGPGAAETAGGGDARCIACGRCAEACPTGARELNGRRASAEELVDEILRDRIFYERSGGGVTFSGGEPLAQPKFLVDLLRRCRAHGLHTCVDTSGYAPEEQVLEIARDVDLFLYDLKLVDAGRHRLCTGVDNERILSNLRSLVEAQRAVTVRIPVIPGISDDPENVSATGVFLSSLGKPPDVVLLPYHPTGEAKYLRLGRRYRLAGTTVPGPEALEGIARELREHRLQVQVGG